MGGIDDWYKNHEHVNDRDPSYDPVNDDVRDPWVVGEDPRSQDLGAHEPRRRRQQRGTAKQAVEAKRGASAKKPRSTGLNRGKTKQAGASAAHPRERRLPSIHAHPGMVDAARFWKGENPDGSAEACLSDLIRQGWPRVRIADVRSALKEAPRFKIQKVVKEAKPVAAPPPESTRRPRSSVNGSAVVGALDVAIRQWFQENPNRPYKQCQDALRELGHGVVSRQRIREVMNPPVPIRWGSSMSHVPMREGCPACGIVPGRNGECRC